MNQLLLERKNIRNRYCLLKSIIVIAALGLAHSVIAAPLYRITDLGLISRILVPNMITDGPVINEAAQVTLNSFVQGVHAFRLGPNQVLNPATDDLGVFGHNTFSTDINNSGQVVGYYTENDSFGSEQRVAFRTAPNQPINLKTDDLGTLGCDFITSANAINSYGQVAGGSYINNQGICIGHAFRTGPNKPINPVTDDLGDLGGAYSEALGINDSGQVVGFSFTVNNELRAFRTSPNKAINPATDDLGAFGDATYATAINAAGQVVGFSYDSSGAHAFRTSANKAINPATDDLGTLGGHFSWATSINASGDVVGKSTTIDGEPHAFLFTQGVMYDLNELIQPNSGWKELSYGASINDRNQIVGIGVLANGESHVFRMDVIK